MTNTLPTNADLAVEQIDLVLQPLLDRLVRERGSESHWTGFLAPSALSTATAISALSLCLQHSATNHPKLRLLVEGGRQWLAAAQNEDGGFGDTDRSPSNLSTTALAIAAWRISDRAIDSTSNSPAIERAERYFECFGGWDGLKQRYGRDQTFVVPILSNCALAGIVSWEKVPQLPFPAACLPQSWYRWAQLPVVSYAIPALVAIGQVRFFHLAPRFWPTRKLYGLAVEPSLRVLHRIQPQSGGYLEATPLTSFVLMSLASMGRCDHPVAQASIRFLEKSVLEDGSWPIDANLATWLSSLVVGAVCQLPKPMAAQAVDESSIEWILNCQHRERHPFTGAPPFGWGWTDLPGAVPDGDDTPAALLALGRWQRLTGDSLVGGKSLQEATQTGVQWLMGLQNRDGGWPTFCRGWGKLPFDRSGADLTAHALRALHACRSELPAKIQSSVDAASRRGWDYLARKQRSDGSWLPLWFGNHNEPNDENPIHGTSRVLIAAADCGWTDNSRIQNGIRYLMNRQNVDGGWGGGSDLETWNARFGRKWVVNEVPVTSSVEETSLALEGLISASGWNIAKPSIIQGFHWLKAAVEENRHDAVWPIGFYFAKLWYHERLYPTIFTVAALARLRRAVSNDQS